MRGARIFLPRSNGRSVIVQSIAGAVGGLIGACLLPVVLRLRGTHPGINDPATDPAFPGAGRQSRSVSFTVGP